MNYFNPGQFKTEALAAHQSTDEIFEAYELQEDALGPGNVQGKIAFMMAREHYKATHDPLTGVANLQGLEEHLAKIGTPRMMVVVDGDGMKQINDRIGHIRGDDFIVETARVLEEGVRSDDFVARIGGDEFMIIPAEEFRLDAPSSAVPPPPSQVIAAIKDRIADKTQELIDDPQNADLHEHGIHFGISVGGAVRQGDMTTADLVQAADNDMYLNKHAKQAENNF